MKENDFKAWLAVEYDSATCSTRLSNCKRVEAFEGDLDTHFEEDRCRSLLEKLTYTREDERENRSSLHSIPIAGDIYNGTATLRASVRLYNKFRELDNESEVNHKTNKVFKNKADRKEWPEWDQPSEQDTLAFAKLAIPYFRFLNPNIIKLIIEDNNSHREEWIRELKIRGIDSDAYLWTNSACVFPGVRRYAGNKEIAAYRGHLKEENGSVFKEAVRLDDNSYPKQIWSFVFRGTKFANYGPFGYALAHLADHKSYGNRYNKDFELVEDIEEQIQLHGLYTSAANAIYVPTSLLKPTDFSRTLRNLLMRRAQQLYGNFCSILPPGLAVPECDDARWQL